MSSYKVFRIISDSPPYKHHAVFVETHESGSGTGYMYHTNGSINLPGGQKRDYRPEVVPEESTTCPFLERIPLGEVSKAYYDGGRFRELCDKVEVPKQQIKDGERLYPDEKLRMCKDWVDDALELLKREGVLVET